VETPSLMMKEWTKEHFHYLEQALKPGGTMTIPIHYDWYIDHDKTSTGFYLYFVPKNKEIDPDHLPALKETEDGQYSLFVRKENGSIAEIKSNIGRILDVSGEHDNLKKDRENIEKFISKMHNDKNLWDKESREVEERASQMDSDITIPEEDLEIYRSEKPKKKFLRYDGQAMQNILKLEKKEDTYNTVFYTPYDKQKEVLPTLEQAKQHLIKKIESDPNKLVFEGFSTPYIFQSEEGKNKEAMDVFTRLITFADKGNNTVHVNYKELKHSEWTINRIEQSFRIIRSKATLTKDLIDVINRNLYDFSYGAKEHMENAIEQHLLEPERIKFIKKFTSRYLIPYTVKFFEDIFGEGHVGFARDKKLPFDVVKERQDMDYVVFKCHKEL